MKSVLLFLLFCGVMSCNTKAEINKMINIKCATKANCRDYYVIKNPPENVDSLISFIESFNDSTLAAYQGVENYSRIFYRETSETSRDYKPHYHWLNNFYYDDITNYNGDDSHRKNLLISYQLTHRNPRSNDKYRRITPYYIYKKENVDEEYYYPHLKKWAKKEIWVPIEIEKDKIN